MLGGVCYVHRYAEDLEGIRAQIPSFKEAGLTYLHLMPLFLAPEPHSDEHEWALKAAAGDPDYSNYYWIYPNRTMPDAFEEHAREIFRDDHPG